MSTTTEGTKIGVAEVPITLEGGAGVRDLGFADQFSLWGNLGVSIALLAVAPFVIAPLSDSPELSLLAAIGAVIFGSIVGNLMLGVASIPGAQMGMPSMVMLRGLLGGGGAFFPTALNVLQLLGWTAFEIAVIAQAGAGRAGTGWETAFIIGAGGAAIAMSIWPIGFIRGVLRKVAVWVVLASTTYLIFKVVSAPMGSFRSGGLQGFFPASDQVVALCVSWIPLVCDYSRHSRSARESFWGTFLGYFSGSLVFVLIGLLVVAHERYVNGTAVNDVDVVGSLLAYSGAAIALAVLAFDELDEAFADLYSAVVSTQSWFPRVDRRLLSVIIGVFCTVGALVFDVYDALSVLLLIGSSFVPLFGAFAVSYFYRQRNGISWHLGKDAPLRSFMFVPWVAGFVVFQILSPTQLKGWSNFFYSLQERLGLSTAARWVPASIVSVVVAGTITFVLERLETSRSTPDVGAVPS